MRKILALAAIVAAVGLFIVPFDGTHAQRRPGGGGRAGGSVPKPPTKNNGQNPWGNPGDWAKMLKKQAPPLKIEDLKPDGMLEVFSLLPASSDDPCLGVTENIAHRLVSYDRAGRTLKFVVLNFKKEEIETKTVKLPKGAPDFTEMPNVSYDGGDFSVLSQQAAVIFVEVAKGKVRVASDFDSRTPIKEVAPPKKKDKKKAPVSKKKYAVHGGANGEWALSLRRNYDAERKTFVGNGATVYGANGKKIQLTWDHGMYGLPPIGRDAVFAVTEDEIIVLTVNPRKAGNSAGVHDLSCIVFDHSGLVKEIQTSPEAFAGSTAKRFALSPDGQFLVAHLESTMKQNVIRRGSWEVGYKTDYHDALIGFVPNQQVGIFLENDTPELASLLALNLASGEVLWRTSVAHEDVRGEGDSEPFMAISRNSKFIAAKWGIFKGQSGKELEFVYKEKASEFMPLSIAYDQKGKSVAVLTRDRVVVFDAKSRKELHSISLPKEMAEDTLGEFVTFNKKGDQIMACARKYGAWLIDLKKGKIVKELKDIGGTWVRAVPDFSGIVFSQSADDGGNVMIQKFDGKPEQIYTRKNDEAQSVCLWIDEKAKKFLMTERGTEEPEVNLIDNKGEVIQNYPVEGALAMLVGDKAITGFVTKKNEAVLINEVSIQKMTGVNCTVLGKNGIQKSFSATFQTEKLPGASTYGGTAASPFFGVAHGGTEKSAYFACPAGALHVDITKSSIKLYAWSREPKGLAAISPKGKEFFVAGARGLTTYKIK